MRNLTALVLLLLCSLYLVSARTSATDRAVQICCPRAESFWIPLKDITTYYKSRSSCPVKAVVFEMKNGNKICVDPNAPWVSSHMEKVDLRSKKPMTVDTSMAARTSNGAEPNNRPKAFHGAQPNTEKTRITEQSTPGPLPSEEPSTTPGPSTTAEQSTTRGPLPTEEPFAAARTSTASEPPNRPEAFHGAQPNTEKPITTEQSTSSVTATVHPGPKAPNQASQICCPRTVSIRIPLKDITSYYKTSSSCPVKAVIFEIKNGRKICVDPNAPWVNSHMERVDLRTNGTVETSTAARTSTGAEPPNRPEIFHGAQPNTEKPIITEQSRTREPSTTAE